MSAFFMVIAVIGGFVAVMGAGALARARASEFEWREDVKVRRSIERTRARAEAAGDADRPVIRPRQARPRRAAARRRHVHHAA